MILEKNIEKFSFLLSYGLEVINLPFFLLLRLAATAVNIFHQFYLHILEAAEYLSSHTSVGHIIMNFE